MPRITIKGMSKEDVKNISGELFDIISNIINRPKDAFTLDLLESVAIENGSEVNRARVEIGWVERPTEVCKEVAEAINKLFSKFNYGTVQVYFYSIDLSKEFIF